MSTPEPPSEQATLPPAAPLGPEGVTLPHTPAPDGETPPLPQVPGYEVLSVLGRGGMGVVYQARQQGLGRLVALKMILHADHAGADQRQRFRAEAEAIARLQHPHIVQIFEVGEHHGHPFFSLEFCPGGSLEAKLRATPLPPREAAALVETLARAMHAAHQAGVIHRDLKPANVLLAADGSPRVTDFGLAKKLDEAGQTQSGAVMGTPSYMAPEQASGQSKAIGPGTDVYALGALLYDCLTGRPPFRAATVMDTLTQVMSSDPAPPSRLNPKVPRDLETICLKCLQKKPERRYATAEALAEDLRRFLSGEPIRARPVGPVERTWKWVRRRPVTAALIGASALALAALLAVIVTFLAVLSSKNRELEQANLDIKGERDRAKQAEGQAREDRDTARTQLDRAQRNLMTSQLLRVAAEHNPWVGRQLLEDVEACPPHLREFAWGYYYHRCHRDDRLLASWTQVIRTMALSPDERFLALGGNKDAAILDAQTGKLLQTLPVRAALDALAFHPNSNLLAIPTESGTVQLWDVAAEKQRGLVKVRVGRIQSLAFSPDGRTLALGGTEGIALWDTIDDKEAPAPPGKAGRVPCLAYSPDGQSLAWVDVGADGLRLRVWDTKSGKERAPQAFAPGFDLTRMSFSPDGKLLALGGNLSVWLWDVASGLLSAPLGGHPKEIQSLSFHPSSKTLAATSADTVTLWDVVARKQLASLNMHGPSTDAAGVVRAAVFTRDGDALITATSFSAAVSGLFRSAEVKRLDVRPESAFATRMLETGRVLSVAFSKDGETLAVVDGLGLSLWRVGPGDKIRTLKRPPSPVLRAQFTPDDQDLVAISLVPDRSSAEVQTWTVADPAEREPRRQLLNGQGGNGTLALSPDGRRLASSKPPSGKGPAGITLGDAGSGKPLRTLWGHTQPVTALAFSADGQTLASGSQDGGVIVWDLASGAQAAVLPGHATPVHSLAFRPDGKLLASGSFDGSIKVWDVAGGKERATARGHTQVVTCLAFSPDGQTLASGSFDRTVLLWEPTTGQQRAALIGHEGRVLCLAFSPNGKTLASAGLDRSVRLWQAEFPP
jgi:WD40 repeat protein